MRAGSNSREREREHRKSLVLQGSTQTGLDPIWVSHVSHPDRLSLSLSLSSSLSLSLSLSLPLLFSIALVALSLSPSFLLSLPCSATDVTVSLPLISSPG